MIAKFDGAEFEWQFICVTPRKKAVMNVFCAHWNLMNHTSKKVFYSRSKFMTWIEGELSENLLYIFTDHWKELKHSFVLDNAVRTFNCLCTKTTSQRKREKKWMNEMEVFFLSSAFFFMLHAPISQQWRCGGFWSISVVVIVCRGGRVRNPPTHTHTNIYIWIHRKLHVLES